MALTPLTAERLRHTIQCIHPVLVVVHQKFCPLNGRTLAEFFLEERDPWRQRMFVEHQEKINTGDIENMECPLLFKLIKYLDLYASDESVLDGKKRLRDLVQIVYDKWQDLRGEPTLSDPNMKVQLDTVRNALLKIIFLVEEMKGVHLAELKCHVRKESCVTSSTESFPHTHKISAKHSIHRVFVMLYNQLNQLDGARLDDYFKRMGSKRNPFVPYITSERKMLERGIPPQKMTVRLLFKLLQRVCGLEDRKSNAWTKETDTLESLITRIEQTHDKIPTKNVDFDWSLNLYQLFEKVLKALSTDSKTKREILIEMPEEPVNLNEAYLSSEIDDLLSGCDTPTPSKKPLLSPVSSEDSLTGLTSLDGLTANELNVACLYYALIAGGPAVKAMSIVFHTLSGDKDKVIRGYKKANITKEDVVKLKSMELKELDITLLFKVIMNGCESLEGEWNKDGYKVPNLLFKLKKIRNNFSHQKVLMSKNELQQKMKELLDLLVLILEETQTLTGKDLKDDIKMIEKEMKRLSKLPVNPDDIEKYKEKVKELKLELCRDTVHKCQMKLIEKYNQGAEKHASPVTWRLHPGHEKFTIEKVFVEPEIDYSNSELGNKSVLSLLNLGHYNPNKLILHGVSGAGKTSICQYLSYTWANSSTPTDLLIMFKCKNTKHNTLVQFLRSFVPSALDEVHNEDVLDILQHLNILFIIDAYDEAAVETKELVRDILFSLPKSAVIITTKDHLVSDINKLFFDATSLHCMSLKVLGFMESKQEQYIRKYFEFAESPEAVRMLTYLNSIDKHHRAFLSLPITLSLFALLWHDNSDKAKEATTLTRIYRQLIQFTLKRFTREKDDINKWVLTLGEVAWRNLKEGRHCLSGKDVKTIMKLSVPLGLTKKEALTALLQSTTVHSGLEDEDEWTFFHNSQQELLAAEYLAENMKNGETWVLDENLSLQVVEFVVGILAEDEELTEKWVDGLIKIISVQNKMAFEVIKRLQLEVGSKHEYFYRKVKDLFKGKYLCKSLNHFDPDCIQWIIENTAVDIPENLQLINSASSVTKMDTFLHSLNEKGCKPQITASIDNLDDIKELLKFLQNDHKINFALKLHIQNAVDLHRLIEDWKWENPLHVVFPKALFPLLWWELKTSLVRNKMIYQIDFSSDQPHFDEYKEGTEQLGLECSNKSNMSVNEIVISTKCSWPSIS